MMTKHNGTSTIKRFPVKSDPVQPMTYQIRIEGHLDDQWTGWFGGMTITLEENGDTLLAGPVVDQAALFGLLKKVRDLGLPLVSLIRVEHGKSDLPKTQPKVTIVEKGVNNEHK